MLAKNSSTADTLSSYDIGMAVAEVVDKADLHLCFFFSS